MKIGPILRFVEIVGRGLSTWGPTGVANHGSPYVPLTLQTMMLTSALYWSTLWHADVVNIVSPLARSMPALCAYFSTSVRSFSSFFQGWTISHQAFMVFPWWVRVNAHMLKQASTSASPAPATSLRSIYLLPTFLPTPLPVREPNYWTLWTVINNGQTPISTSSIYWLIMQSIYAICLLAVDFSHS